VRRIKTVFRVSVQSLRNRLATATAASNHLFLEPWSPQYYILLAPASWQRVGSRLNDAAVVESSKTTKHQTFLGDDGWVANCYANHCGHLSLFGSSRWTRIMDGASWVGFDKPSEVRTRNKLWELMLPLKLQSAVVVTRVAQYVENAVGSRSPYHCATQRRRCMSLGM